MGNRPLRVRRNAEKIIDAILEADDLDESLMAATILDSLTANGWGHGRDTTEGTVWSLCGICSAPIFRHYAWSHQGGTPARGHIAAPEDDE